VVYVGPFESPESCEEWKREHALDFPVVPDPDGGLFRRWTSGWVPWSLLVAADGEVVFTENEFDEAGFSAAIERVLAAGGATPAAESGATAGSSAFASSSAAPPPATRAQLLWRPGSARIVILGGGVGGIVAAHELRARLGARHRIVVVDRSPDHLFQPSLLWLMTGQRGAAQIRRPLERLSRRGIEFVRDEVVEIDVARRTVRTEHDAVDFDYLIVALGARTAPESIDGFDEMALDLYSLEGSERIRTTLDSFTGGSVAVLVTSMPFKCPAAPYEAAFLVESALRAKGIRERSEIHLFTPEHQPMPVAPRALGDSIVELLRSRSIHYHPLFNFEALRPATREIVAAGGERHALDLLIAVPPHEAPAVVRSSGLLGVSGWIPVDAGTLRTEREGVFAVGDVAHVKLPSGKSLPKAGVFAHHQARVVARQIADQLRGRESRARFDGRGSCWIELGDGSAGYATGSFFSDPEPILHLARPGRVHHWTKVAFEKWWLWRWL
jgi:sulfide:quinone oxidoreductase